MKLINTQELAQTCEPPRPKAYRFDIFKGTHGETGRVTKVRSVGAAYLVDGCKTYTVYLKAFLKDLFYLLPDETKSSGHYSILTREPSRRPGRKYFWNNVGEGVVMSDLNAGFVKLEWDVLGANDIYMNLHPREVSPAQPTPLAAQAN